MSRSLKGSFKRAFLGFKVGFAESNFRRHLVSTISALICVFYYHLSMFELVIIILCIFLVLSAELMNTAIERLAHGHQNPRDALDVSASAVLLIAVGSFVVGLIILLPHAWESPWVLIGVIIITPILWVFMEKNGSSK